MQAEDKEVFTVKKSKCEGKSSEQNCPKLLSNCRFRISKMPRTNDGFIICQEHVEHWANWIEKEAEESWGSFGNS